MTSLRLVFGHLAVAAALALGGAAHAGHHGTHAGDAALTTEDPGTALVLLAGEPLATHEKTRPARGGRIDFAHPDSMTHRARLVSAHDQYKAWLRANVPAAKVTFEFEVALNAVAIQLNGATLEQISKGPMVARAEHQHLHSRRATDPDLAIIRAPAAWAGSGGASHAGEGVKVAIIDSGIDITHPCFSDAGYPAREQRGDRRYTNNKVIVARSFATDPSAAAGVPTVAHGTHVAGIVACNSGTVASVEGAAIPYAMSGVAPRALLGNYNISGTSRTQDVLRALEMAYADGMDVANMSLGGFPGGRHSLLTLAVDNLDCANMVVAVAAGNSGPGYGTVETPGLAQRALSAGASSVGHWVVHMLNSGGSSFESVLGDFGKLPAGDLTAPLAVVFDPASEFGGISTGCDPIANPSLAGKIALVSRGGCDFVIKVLNLEGAGALAAIVVDRLPGEPYAMSTDSDPDQPHIPGLMVGLSARDSLKARDGQLITVPALGTYVRKPGLDDIIYASGSGGPTEQDFRVKPDVIAPGVNVLSAIPRSFCGGAPCFAFMQGTSMATPHLAGSAAVVRQQHPGWSAADVRSAIVNTATIGAVKAADGRVIDDVNIVGAGREDLKAAVNARLLLDPVSITFGAVSASDGRARQQTIELTNVSAKRQSYSLSVDSARGGVGFSVSPSNLVLEPGASARVRVALNGALGGAAGHKQATLNIKAGADSVAHAALFAIVN